MEKDARKKLVAEYKDGYRVVADALVKITPEELDARPGAGKWNAREIVHHLGDSEMNAASRVRMLVAEQDALIQGYDEKRWTQILYTRERPIEPSMVAFKAAREATLPLLRLLTDEQWTRVGTHTQFGPMSAEHWLAWYGPHAHDHADQIRRARIAAYG